METSQEDIARALGISRASVNQVLNDSPHCRVSDQLRQRILDTARAMGYKGRPLGPPRKAGGQAIAYVLCKNRQKYKIFPWEWHLTLLYNVQKLVRDTYGDLVFLAADDHPREQHEVLLSVARLRPRGVILDGDIQRNLVYEFLKLNIPLLVSGLLEYAAEPQWAGKLSSVSIDIEQNVDLLISRLVERQARKIGMLINPGVLYSNKMMQSAYRKAMQRHGLAVHPAWVQVYDECYDDASLLNRHKAQGIDIDGLICPSNHLPALGHYQRENRLPLPAQRIAVCATYPELKLFGVEGMICLADRMPYISQVTFDHLRHVINHPNDHKHVKIFGMLHEED